MNASNPSAGDWASNNARNTRVLAYWTSAWVISQAVAVFGPSFLWSDNTLLTTLAVLVNVVLGIGMILANRRQLRGLDELQQQIQMQAMGLTLGVGLVAGLAYSTLDITNLIPGDAEISHLVILMGLTYLLGTILGSRKYR
jgi:hypothetical protein